MDVRGVFTFFPILPCSRFRRDVKILRRLNIDGILLDGLKRKINEVEHFILREDNKKTINEDTTFLQISQQIP